MDADPPATGPRNLRSTTLRDTIIASWMCLWMVEGQISSVCAAAEHVRDELPAAVRVGS